MRIIGFFMLLLLTSCLNRAKAASDNQSNGASVAAAQASARDDVSYRLIYSPEIEDGIADEPLDTNAVYIDVEEMPEFPGGFDAQSEYVRKTVRYPEACQKDSIQGRVIIFIVVEKDGSISNAKVAKSVHEELDAEALRVVRAMPKWKPGRHKGVALRVRCAVPVNFRLKGSNRPVEWVEYDEASR